MSARNFMLIELPDSVRLLPTDPQALSRRVLEGLVIGAYTEGVISRGRAYELLGLDYWRGEEIFTKRGIGGNYGWHEFQCDRAD